MEANGEEIVGIALANDDEGNEKKLGYGTVSNDKDCYEFCFDMDGGRDNCKMRPSYLIGEYGDSSSWKGVYRFSPCREADAFEFWRGNYATGVRGIIDPLDPDNPYGPKSAADLGDMDFTKSKLALKNMSAVSKNTTLASLNDMNLSKISNVSQIDISDADIDLGDGVHGCLYQRGKVGPMASIFLTRSMTIVNQEIPPCPDGIYFDDAVAKLQEFTKGQDLSKISSLKCHVNTWGLSSNNWFADEMVSKMKGL